MSTPGTLDAAALPSTARVSLPALLADPLPLRLIEPAPCTAACPAGVNVKAYVSLIAEGRFAEALAVVRQHCTLPSVCGRVCHAPCEPACRRAEYDDPLAIRALKRFVADLGLTAPPEAADPPTRSERVAVVGSGPAGLAAAADLRGAGFPVTVIEAMSEAGGMLRYGIADYRLPPDVLDAEIGFVLSSGIDLQTDTPITDFSDVTGLLTGGYSAVLLALGAQNGRLLGLDGEDARGVEDALGFLRRVNTGDHVPLNGTILVIGGGSTAVEAARTALRLGGSRVEVIYRRSRSELRAGPEEIAAAEEEGVAFRFLAAPQRFLHNGSLQGLECLQMALGEPDAEGRPRPVPIPGSEFVVEAVQVLVAVGQLADLDFIADPAGLVDKGWLHIDPATAMTEQWGIFAAGDVVTGPTTVIEAIASGHEAAASMIRYLDTGTPGRRRPTAPGVTELGLTDPDPVEAPQIRPTSRAIEPGHEFAEVEQPYAAEQAIAEAARCLRCGPCSECAVCAPGCERRHLFMHLAGKPESSVPLRVTSDLALGLGTNGAIPGELVDSSTPSGTGLDLRPMRMSYTAELCRGCARCIEVCGFDAVAPGASPDAPVVFDPAACRGCALCGAVCPTGSLVPVAHSPEWWDALEPNGEPPPIDLTLTCDVGPTANNAISCRCVGQAHPGMLLGLFLKGVHNLTVAPCADCRFGAGARLAAQHVEETAALLAAVGQNGSSVELATTPWEGE